MDSDPPTLSIEEIIWIKGGFALWRMSGQVALWGRSVAAFLAAVIGLSVAIAKLLALTGGAGQ